MILMETKLWLSLFIPLLKINGINNESQFWFCLYNDLEVELIEFGFECFRWLRKRSTYLGNYWKIREQRRFSIIVANEMVSCPIAFEINIMGLNPFLKMLSFFRVLSRYIFLLLPVSWLFQGWSNYSSR